MELVKPDSLAATLDAINEAQFWDRALSRTQRREAAAWLAGRQGQRGHYRCMPAPTRDDFANHPPLFTGERISSGAGTSHILGQEACRALILLDVHTQAIDDALGRAQAWLRAPQDRSDPRYGMYCCGRCSVALWRHLAVSRLPGAEHRVAAGVKLLERRRDGKGRWKVFPYYYTLLALLDIDLRAACQERRYAAPALERLRKRRVTGDAIAQRRRALAERVLARC